MNKSTALIPELRAICHDERSLISGQLRGITELGCEFLGPSRGDTPTFPKKTLVCLNLVDESTGRTQNIQVRLSGVSRRDGRWSYRMQWDELPEILAPYRATQAA